MTLSNGALIQDPESLIEYLGIQQPDEIDIEAIAQFCGATVVYEQLRGCAARLLGVDARAIITVDRCCSRPRQRFSVAHELGHWMRNRGKIGLSCPDASLFSEGQTSSEREADQFAMRLLMPKRVFRPLAVGCPINFQTVRGLGRAFGTSLTATAIRLVELADIPALVVCIDFDGRRWFLRNRLVSRQIQPRLFPLPGALALALLAQPGKSVNCSLLGTDHWFQPAAGLPPMIREDSIHLPHNQVLSLLSWG
jgi:hypothetical protein